MENTKLILCCLYKASTLCKGMNITSDIHLRISMICFPQNMSLDGAADFLNKSRPLINKAACVEEHINKVSICEMPTTKANIGYTVFLIALMLLVLSTNMFFCMAMFHSRALLDNPSHRFILSLAISDLLIALVIIPIKIDFTIHNQAFCSNEKLCHIAYFVDHLICLSSILILLAIGIDRYIALSNPYKYQRLMNKQRSVAVIISIWIFSCIGGIMANVDLKAMTFEGAGVVNYNCITKIPNYTGAVLIAGFFVPLIAMGFLYYKIFRITLNHALPIATMGDFPGSNGDNKRTQSISCFSNAKLRAMRVVVIVYGSFVACWVPANIMTILQLWWPKAIDVKMWQFHLFSEILPLSNSALNIFIYAAMNEDCKKAMQKLLMCKVFQKRIHKKRFKRESLRRESARTLNFSTNASDI